MLSGGCMCGAVRYASEAAPFHASFCHCIDCRRASGAPVMAWFTVPRASLRVTGTPARHASSPGVERAFCARCGTALFFEAANTPDETDVTAASLDDPAQAAPAAHIWTRDRIEWMRIADDLPVHDRARSAG
jgi:hypothetical protein